MHVARGRDKGGNEMFEAREGTGFWPPSAIQA
jgi:hypothetical protein